MKKRIKGKKIWIVALLVCILAAAGIYAGMGQAVSVKAQAADLGPVEVIISETGAVEARDSVTVSSKTTGLVEKLTVSEGDRVTAGQLILTYGASSTSADISGINAQISGLQVQYNQAKDLAAKNKTLYDQGAISYEEYNQVENTSKELSAQIVALQYQIKSISEATASGGITAPSDGTVTAVFVKEGELVGAGAPIIEIADLSNIIIKINLVSEDADLVKEGDAVRLYRDGSSLIDEKASVGKIYLKAQEVMSELGIYQKRVPVEIVSPEAGNLRLGSDIDAEIITEKKDNVLRIPENAYFELSGETYAYAVRDGKAVLQKITVGLLGEGYVEVTGGLAEGDQVILSPENEISDGTKVKISE